MAVSRRRAPPRAGGAFSRDRDTPWGTENGSLGNAACHSLAESGTPPGELVARRYSALVASPQDAAARAGESLREARKEFKFS